MKKQRPVNLQLNTISFPPAAITSILHRITGVAMFFALMFVIWAWATSVSSKQGFVFVQEQMAGPLGKFVAIGTISALTYHILGGVRHMIMDMGFGESLKVAKITSMLVIILGVISAVLWGWFLWL